MKGRKAMELEPYFELEGATIYCGDAVSVLGLMQDKSVDLFVTDPPYGTRQNLRDGWMVGEFSDVLPITLPELYRVGTEDAGFYCFTSWSRLADWIFRVSPFFRMQNLIVWDKGRHSGCWGKYSWQFCWEGIYYGIKGPREIREYHPDILRSAETGKRKPMQKPVDVLQTLVRASTDEGQLVLDPFVGTGSLLLAAFREGRKSVGIEIEERYCEIAAQRLVEEWSAGS